MSELLGTSWKTSNAVSVKKYDIKFVVGSTGNNTKRTSFLSSNVVDQLFTMFITKQNDEKEEKRGLMVLQLHV